ncbi:MAG: DUF134 domain-containing protein [Desulfovibrio sp.]|nr:DUF134 domain-containing protein [Desulfovibrio sp.]
MRPCKPRTIGFLPENLRFVPELPDNGPAIHLGLDMLEAIRLADAEGLPQDDAAARMGISPATFCRLVGEARRRTALALSDGRTIVIDVESGNAVFRPDGNAGEGVCPGRHGFGGPRGRGRHGGPMGRGRD